MKFSSRRVQIASFAAISAEKSPEDRRKTLQYNRSIFGVRNDSRNVSTSSKSQRFRDANVSAALGLNVKCAQTGSIVKIGSRQLRTILTEDPSPPIGTCCVLRGWCLICRRLRNNCIVHPPPVLYMQCQSSILKGVIPSPAKRQVVLQLVSQVLFGFMAMMHTLKNEN